MKKLSIFLPILFVVSLVFANRMFFASKAEIVSKDINVSIFSNSDYSSSAYDSAMAQVQVTVTRISGNESSVLLSKTFDAEQLKKYPTVKDAVANSIHIAEVSDDKESILVTYTVTYNTKGSIISFENNQVIGKGTQHEHLKISI